MLQIITIDGKDFLCSDIEQFNKFKTWVEGTKLYTAIIQYSGNPNCRIEGIDDDLYISLDLTSKKVTSIEEFPKELLFQFYINSPFYNEKDKQNYLSKLFLTDGTSD